MWTREELKSNAKLVLRRTYWLSFVVCLAAGFLAGVSGSFNGMISFPAQHGFEFPLSILLIVGVFSLLYRIFISNPIEVGLNHFFMTSREYDDSLGKIFYAFSNRSYLNIVKTLFKRDLFILLWTLALIIPGYIKAFQYIFVPYIIAENPELPSERAFEISKAMTKGDKFNIFVLFLSFIGWWILGLLACCIGMYFVVPYINATFAELYAAKRTEALMHGYATERELCGFRNSQI